LNDPGVAPYSVMTVIFYAAVNSRIDNCNTVLAGAPRTVRTSYRLQRVLNAAARVVTGTRKFDRGLCQILKEELHWLDVPDRVIFKLAVTVHRCLNGPQSGTLSRISSGTRPSVRTVSDGCLKRTCSLDTNAFSALEVLTITALYKFTYLLTYFAKVDSFSIHIYRPTSK